MKQFLLHVLSERPGTLRCALYEYVEAEGKENLFRGLQPLWAKKDADGRIFDGKKALQYPHQVYSKLKNLPAFHFMLSGYGYSKRYELADSLAQFFKEDVELVELDGLFPGTAQARYRSKEEGEEK